jgi:hypothetical protein
LVRNSYLKLSFLKADVLYSNHEDSAYL